jgi:hypothetical protein
MRPIADMVTLLRDTGLMICFTESLLVCLQAKMDSNGHSTGSQFNVIFK